MDENNSMELALSKLSLQENDVIVVKFKYGNCPVDNLAKFMDAIRNISPCPVIAIPDVLDIGAENIDRVIQYLEDMKKN